MKISFFTLLLCVYGFAEELKAKIDMHGGKEHNIYEKKSDFKRANYGISALLDTNATEREKPTKK